MGISSNHFLAAYVSLIKVIEQAPFDAHNRVEERNLDRDCCDQILKLLNQKPICIGCQRSLSNWTFCHVTHENLLHVFHAACTPFNATNTVLSCPHCDVPANNFGQIATIKICENLGTLDEVDLSRFISVHFCQLDIDKIAMEAVRHGKENLIMHLAEMASSDQSQLCLILLSALESCVTYNQIDLFPLLLNYIKNSRLISDNDKKTILSQALLESINQDTRDAMNLLMNFIHHSNLFPGEVSNNAISSEQDRDLQMYLFIWAFLDAIRKSEYDKLRELMQLELIQTEEGTNSLESLSFLAILKDDLDMVKIFYPSNTPLNIKEAIVASSEKGFINLLSFFVEHEQFKAAEPIEKAKILGAALAGAIIQEKDTRFLVEKIRSLQLDLSSVNKAALDLAAGMIGLDIDVQEKLRELLRT